MAISRTTSGWGRSQQPVINVNWDDAQQYVAWLSKMTGKTYRLLTEAEYEYAARAGTTTAYPWGDDIGKDNANCNGCGSQWDNQQTAPVGRSPPNKFGLYDMVGQCLGMGRGLRPRQLQRRADGWLGVDRQAAIAATVSCAAVPGTPLQIPSAPRAATGTPSDPDRAVGFRVVRTLLTP